MSAPSIRAVSDTSSHASSARAFIAAYEQGDAAQIRALCAPHARARYVPWGDRGENPVARAVETWSRYPAAFDGFAMPIQSLYEDHERGTVVLATLNQGRQRADVDGIATTGRAMACPHLFVLAFDEEGLIAQVQIWCDQLTLYQQLGFPVGFAAEPSA